MDKIGKILILIIVLSSCSNKKNSNIENNKIIFYYDKFIIVDFGKKELRANYEGFEYKDTIVITEAEESIITNSFKKNKIDELNGNLMLQDCRPSLIPSFENRIDIYAKGKLKSTISIKSNDANPLNTPSFNSPEYRIFCFHDDIKKIILKNMSFIRVLDAFRKFRIESTF